MTGKLKARFAGGNFICVDDVEVGTHITAVVRPEDVILCRPEDGIIKGTVTSVIFKGMHYEITVESGKNEMVIQSVNTAQIGEEVGMNVAPDNIHIMIAEDNTNFFKIDIGADHRLEYNGIKLGASLTKLVKGSKRSEEGQLLDASGEVIDISKLRVTASIRPSDVKMTDVIEDGLVSRTHQQHDLHGRSLQLCNPFR